MLQPFGRTRLVDAAAQPAPELGLPLGAVGLAGPPGLAGLAGPPGLAGGPLPHHFGPMHCIAVEQISDAPDDREPRLPGMLLAILSVLPAPASTPAHVAMTPVAGPGWLDRLNAWRASTSVE